MKDPAQDAPCFNSWCESARNIAARNRGILLNKPLAFQFFPERCRNLVFHRTCVCKCLSFRMRPDNQGSRHVRSGGELKGRCAQIDAELLRHRPKPVALRYVSLRDIPSTVTVVEARTARDKTGVQCGAHDETDLVLTSYGK